MKALSILATKNKKAWSKKWPRVLLKACKSLGFVRKLRADILCLPDSFILHVALRGFNSEHCILFPMESGSVSLSFSLSTVYLLNNVLVDLNNDFILYVYPTSSPVDVTVA